MKTQRGERLQVMLTPEELEALDDFRFARRMPSRASAIRELLRRGLGVETGNIEERRLSKEFGVLEGGGTQQSGRKSRQ